MTDTTTADMPARGGISDQTTTGLVASRRGVRIDTEIGWSAVVAMDAEDCDVLAASFTAMAGRLRERPDVVAAWDALAMLDTGDAKEDEIPEAVLRADEREQLAEAGRLLPAPTETTTEWGVWWHGDDPDGIVMSEQHMSNRQWAERVGAERIGQHGIKSYTVRCCVHRKFADGSVWISAWTKAPAEVNP